MKRPDAQDNREDPELHERDLFAARLRQAIGRLARIIRTDGQESVPPLQLSAMVTIGRHGPLLTSELVRLEAVRAPTISRAVISLESRGLITRRPDPHDSRRMILALTQAGAETLDEVRRHRTAVFATRLARLTDAQRATLQAALPALEAMFLDDDAAGSISEGREGVWHVGHGGDANG